MISTWGSAGGLGPIFSSANFYAPLVSSLALTYGTGSATFTRATTATCFGYAENAIAGASQQLLTIPAGIPRFSGARFKASTNTWDIALSDGTPIPSSQLLGYLSEGAATNFFLNSGVPATQTTGSLGTGTYTCWLTGTGSIAISAGTATITGAGTATAGSPVTFTVTVAGTVVCTVAGTPSTAQVENTAFPTSYIATVGASVTRNADVATYLAANINNTTGTAYAEISQISVKVGLLSYILIDSGSGRSLIRIPNTTTTTQVSIFDGTNTVTQTGLTSDLNSIQKRASSWGSSGLNITGNGLTPATGAFVGTFNFLGLLCIGGVGDAAQHYGNIRNVRIWQSQLPNSSLQAITQ